MKTTVLIDDPLYQWLVNEAIRRHGHAKSLSTTLNEILRQRSAPTRSLFGSLKRFDLADLRDEHDRLA